MNGMIHSSFSNFPLSSRDFLAAKEVPLNLISHRR
jgi:hypothetical protein